MGTTANGLPYPEGADPPDVPTDIRELAVAVDAALATRAVWTPAAGWVDYGGSFGGLHVTRTGGIVNVSGMVKPTADLPVTVNTNYVIGTIPASTAPYLLTPAASRIVATYVIIGGATAVARLQITAAGQISFYAPSTGTIAASGSYIGVHATYRGA